MDFCAIYIDGSMSVQLDHLDERKKVIDHFRSGGYPECLLFSFGCDVHDDVDRMPADGTSPWECVTHRDLHFGRSAPILIVVDVVFPFPVKGENVIIKTFDDFLQGID